MDATLDHTMIRVEDLEETTDWYSEHLDYVEHGRWEADSFTNVFMGPEEVHDEGALLELTYNHDDRSYEMGDAWGHIAVRVPEGELESEYDELLDEGVEDYRDPESCGGNYAFVTDPDGHEIEIVQREHGAKWSLDHTMMRIEDADAAIGWYAHKLDYEMFRRSDNEDFALYFLKPEDAADEAMSVELTYNYDEDGYEMGDAWGHVAVRTDDLDDAWEALMTRTPRTTAIPSPVTTSTRSRRPPTATRSRSSPDESRRLCRSRSTERFASRFRSGVSRVISSQDHEFFHKNGYLRVEDAVPTENCDAVADAIWEFMGKDPDDPGTWYTPPEGLSERFGGGNVEMYHHQSMWDVRQHPRVYQAFAELLDEERLWVSLDRCNLTPPVREERPSEGDNAFVHWDVDTSPLPARPVRQGGTEAVPYGVQGVLYLDDTSEDQGGFQCVPSIYRDLDGWVERQPDDRDSLNPDIGDHAVESIPGEKGDLVIWDSLLPHGNGRNHADSPRLAQYVNMVPERFRDATARGDRIEKWRNRAANDGEAFSGDPRRREREHPVPELTSLGQKLLGTDPWPGWTGA